MRFLPTSVFSITPVDEEYAVALAKRLKKHPIKSYEHQQLIREIAKKAVGEMKMDEIKRLIASGGAMTRNNQDDYDEDEYPM